MSEDAEPTLRVGDVVRDREDDDPDDDVLLVTARYVRHADEMELEGGDTVADHNPAYPPDDRVIGITYVATHTMNVGHQRTYHFPRSRLERVHSPHEDHA